VSRERVDRRREWPGSLSDRGSLFRVPPPGGAPPTSCPPLGQSSWWLGNGPTQIDRLVGTPDIPRSYACHSYRWVSEGASSCRYICPPLATSPRSGVGLVKSPENRSKTVSGILEGVGCELRWLWYAFGEADGLASAGREAATREARPRGREAGTRSSDSCTRLRNERASLPLLSPVPFFGPSVARTHGKRWAGTCLCANQVLVDGGNRGDLTALSAALL
jgi:hypothetical protein